jgi:hypothetical protein
MDGERLMYSKLEIIDKYDETFKQNALTEREIGFNLAVELHKEFLIHILDKIMLCPQINCDKGSVITDVVTAEGRFELTECPTCKGRGFLFRQDVEQPET